ncbi:MAG TPA: TetR/AcrR family transcriptional regulator, partial [Candidatus Cloacimonadota bacterium]|nr:TetR/AcrR family transcriptional regulator [Candidatus Cloacimonadota bacterium]
MNNRRSPRRSAIRKSKRDIIIEKAIEVFAAKGSELTTIADIAKKARIAQGTVYVYFESKDDLLKHCMKEIITAEINTIIEATAQIPDTMDRLFEFFVKHIELVKNKPYVARFLTLETRQHEEFYLHNPDFNPLKLYLDFVLKVTREAIAVGRIRNISADAMAY